MLRLSSLLSLSITLCATAGLYAQDIDDLRARAIGPATMSGRVACIDACQSDPNLLWVGAATGGVWKSTNGGLTFKPVFDDQPVASIGAIAIDPHHPDIVWVGTGEGNPRNSSSVGRGMFLTRDGGATWTRLGLEATERIHRIVLHPRRQGVAWVAALGRAWGESSERGVYRTVDFGRTWKRVLYVDPRTGCADLVADPRDPDKLFAAMWDYRRHPWSFRSGGPGSGLFVSRDGGDTWQRLGEEAGLPEGELGRMGLAIAPSDPDVVYALIEAKRSKLYRSSDGGKSFRMVNDDKNIAPRPFYYADIRICPDNPNRIYNLHSTMGISEDGGKSFETLVGWKIHPDHHALWIHPHDGKHLIDGSDGGIAISRDRGRTWRYCRRLPLAQFYHLNVDREQPYNILGGLQDNGSWRGPSRVLENSGIRNAHWQEVCFGDGFATLADPEDARRGYAMSQQGYLVRWNLHTGEKRDIRPLGTEDAPLRFGWNAGIAQCPHDPATIYFGSQFLHRSRDRGESWEAISPDLTTNNPDWQRQADSGGLTPDVTGAENFTTILTIAPSPLEAATIWVGTDDGRLQLTRDGGATWTDCAPRLPGVPRHTWIPHVEADRFDPAKAYIVLDDHRRSNWTTYAYATSDYGVTWRSITTPRIDGYAHVIEQDVVDPDLLFLGTEFGLWWSNTGGKRWEQFRNGVPTVAVRALTVHPDTHDLVVGTHGRAAFVVDNIAPLRVVGRAGPPLPIELLAPQPVTQWRIAQTIGSRFPADGEFRGSNRAYGALIDVVLHALEKDDDKADEIELEIRDATGETVKRFDSFKAKAGLHRLRWNLREDIDPEEGERRARNGLEVLPGRFQVHLKWGEHEIERPLIVQADPREEFRADERAAKHAALIEIAEVRGKLLDARDRLDDLRADLKLVRARIKTLDKASAKAVSQAADELGKQLDALERELRIPAAEDRGIRRTPHLLSRAGRVRGSMSSSRGGPTAAQLEALQRTVRDATELHEAFEKLEEGPVQALGAALDEAGLGLLRTSR